MDERELEMPHVSEKQKIKALNLVISADGFLAQRQLLKALNLYKESAEILPDPDIIRKIKKLRKYMKRNDMDLGENKENQNEPIVPEKPLSLSRASNLLHKTNQSLGDRINSACAPDRFPQASAQKSADIFPTYQREPSTLQKTGSSDSHSTIPAETSASLRDRISSITISESSSSKGRSERFSDSVPPERSGLKSGSPASQDRSTPPRRNSGVVPAGSLVLVDDADDRGILAKRDIRHQKKGSESSRDKESYSSREAAPAKSDPEKNGKVSQPRSHDPIASFKDLRKRMYPHQREGMKWLARLFGEQKGGILGDDMGLGKTLQVIGYLYKMFEVNEIEHVLIVMPTALILPWQSEMARWAPTLNIALFHGKTRKSRLKVLHGLQRTGGVLLTSYGLIVTNYEELSKGPDGREFVWDYVFLDEGHKIKNPTKTQKSAHYIPARHRVIITGTPIQNNLIELWSLYDFVHHGSLLGTLKTFKIRYENPITRARQKDASLEEKQLGYRMAQNLQKIIAPYFLRRTKAELLADPNSGLPRLPRKNDIIVWVKMTPDQKKVYESYLKLDEVKELMSSSRSPLVALNILKKICDHLRLLSMRICKALGMLTSNESRKFSGDPISHLDDPLEIPEWTRQPEAEEPTNAVSSKQVKETDCAATQLTGIPDAILYKESSKLMVLIELLGYMSATGHKCLVFSQSTKMLDIIQQILVNLHYKHVRMDGQITSLEQRAEIIHRFEINKDIHIFLLTTQVGGVGLNLTVADRIIIVDPSWNPAIDSQAVDRVYRIGQDKNVMIFRLITCGSVEEKIYIRQLFKLSINKQTMKESKDPFRYFTKQDLKQLFIVEDLSVSETQLQLAAMHAKKRVRDEVVDDQIHFLESMDHVFGVSDHDLVFSAEDEDQQVQVSNSRLQTMVEKAEEAIRNEINEESRANSRKVVPGIQERQPPSVDMWTTHPTRASGSPLLKMYTEEEGQRDVRHRRSNSARQSVSPRPSENADRQTDHDTTGPLGPDESNKVVVLSDSGSEGNESNEVIMDSEDERPPPTVQRPVSTFNTLKHPEHGQSSSRRSDSGTPEIKTSAQPSTSNPYSLANKTLMQAIVDSPMSPKTSGLTDVLVADSPDLYTRRSPSSSEHSNASSARITVAESDYESEDNFGDDSVVVDSQSEVSGQSLTKDGVGESDSREFCSPAFRDVSVVIPNSSPQAGSIPASKKQAGSVSSSRKQAGSVTASKKLTPTSTPLSADPGSRRPEGGTPSKVDSLVDRLNTSLALDESIVRSVRRKGRRYRVLSSSDSEEEDGGDSQSVLPEIEDGGDRSSLMCNKSLKDASLSLKAEDPGKAADVFFVDDEGGLEEDDTNSRDNDEARKSEVSFVNKAGSAIASPSSEASVGFLDKQTDRRTSGAFMKGSRIASPLSETENIVRAEQPGRQSSGSLPKGKKRCFVISSDSSSENDEGDENRAQSPILPTSEKRNIRKARKFIVVSSDDDDDDERVEDETDDTPKIADGSMVVTEELNIVVDPSEPVIRCVKTPPAKASVSRLAKSFSSPFRRGGPRSPVAERSFDERRTKVVRESGPRNVAAGEGPSTGGAVTGLALTSAAVRHAKVGNGERDSSSPEEEDIDDDDVHEDDDDDGRSNVEKETSDDDDDDVEESEEEGVEEEEESNEEEEEEEQEEKIELPVGDSNKTASYNEYIEASRDAYYSADYMKALRHALRALQEDSSDIKLQIYALWLRKMTQK